MQEPSMVAITFQDLSDAAAVLSAGRTSPRSVQQGLTRFLGASHRLTEHMRKEYKAKTGKPWEAGEFEGWNDVTELFKELRRVDHHVRPVTVLVHETQYFSIYEGGPEVAVGGTWVFSLEDQMRETPRDDLRAELADPETGRPSGRMVDPVRKEYEFHLGPSSAPSSPKALKLLAKIGDPNVRTLSQQCFKVLTEYYRYYQYQLAQ